MKLILFIVLCLALAACGGPPQQSPTPIYTDLVIMMERTVTDLPTTITSITLDGQSKRISHYGIGGNPEVDNAPKELYELENKIDEIVNSEQWVGH